MSFETRRYDIFDDSTCPDSSKELLKFLRNNILTEDEKISHLSSNRDLLICCNTLPLMIALECGFKLPLFLIDEGGADVNKRDTGDSTLLQYAVQFCCEEHFYESFFPNEGFNDYCEFIVELIKRNADVNVTSEYDFSPLVIACYHCNSIIVELLLLHKADPNVIQPRFQSTALMTAVDMLCSDLQPLDEDDDTVGNMLEIVLMLLMHGANVGIKGGDNKNALETLYQLLAKDDDYFDNNLGGKENKACIFGIAGVIKQFLDKEIRDNQFDERKEAIKLFEIVNIIDILYIGDICVFKEIMSYL
jgi:ankyrin repeat protein